MTQAWFKSSTYASEGGVEVRATSSGMGAYIRNSRALNLGEVYLTRGQWFEMQAVCFLWGSVEVEGRVPQYVKNLIARLDVKDDEWLAFCKGVTKGEFLYL